MKVLFLVRQLNIGGAERQLVIVANELASRGHEVVITSFYTGGALSKQLDTRARAPDLLGEAFTLGFDFDVRQGLASYAAKCAQTSYTAGCTHRT